MAQYVRPTLGQAIQSGSVRVGRYTRVDTVTSGWAGTGSNAGGSAVLVASGVSAGNVNLIDGGTIAAADLSANHVFEIEPGSINVTAGTVYVLYGHAR